MKYAFIESDLVGEFPLSVICRELRVTRAGHHAWLKRPASAMKVARDVLAVSIRRVFAAFNCYDSRAEGELLAQSEG